MADIELVIKITEEEYERFKKNQKKEYSESMLDVNIIANGTPLPKGHGRLIDVSKLNDVEIYDRSNDMYGASSDQIMNAPTIIEADKAGKERMNEADN